MEQRTNCYGCPDRNTAEHPNPNCHTMECPVWKNIREEKERAIKQRREYALSTGYLAEGYRRRVCNW